MIQRMARRYAGCRSVVIRAVFPSATSTSRRRNRRAACLSRRSLSEAYAYTKVLRPYQAIAHARGEYARGDVSTNGIESFWALLKRGYRGTYHSWSPKHLDRYVREFSGRHNARPLDLLDRMGAMAGGLDGSSVVVAVTLGTALTRFGEAVRVLGAWPTLWRRSVPI